MGLGAETRKSVVDKHLCSRDNGGHYDQHANRTASKYLLIRVSRVLDTPSIKQDGRKIAWKKERKMQTRLGGGMCRFTEAKTCRGG